MSKNPAPQSNNIFMAQEVVRLDPDAMDMILRSHGVVMEHWQALKCPIGVDDRFDVRFHGNHSDCSNGFIYSKAGEVTVFFSGNSSSSTLEEMGVVDGSTTQITLPRNYDNSDKEIAVQHYDRFFLKEIATYSVNTQLIEAHITGVDRLQYPASAIDLIIDANGVRYNPADYTVDGGHVKWLTPNRPPYDAKLNRGTIYSIRYRYVPFWYVKNIIHEVRVARVHNYQTGQDDLVRMPYAVQLQREYLFEAQEKSNDPQKNTEQSVKAPRTGSFGPR